MKVLSVTSECAPLLKTGGLADVAGALPGALAPLGIDMRTLLPGYPAAMSAISGGAAKPKPVREFPALFGGPARLLEARAAGLDLLILDAPHLFDRPGNPYLGPRGTDWPDNPLRFAALCDVASDIAADGAGKWLPEVVHCHDWQAGLTPVYMRKRQCKAVSVLTIHNVAFHGLAPMEMAEDLRLAPEEIGIGGFEFWGQISALKAGIMTATRLTTVSRTYARELMTEEFGMGLDGVLRDRAHVLSGILNGIDETAWDPAQDPALAKNYKTPAGKKPNKAALRAEFDLPASDGPLCCVVSRLTGQKGLDLLLQALPALVDRGGQLALLGTGDPGIEAEFQAAAAAHPHVSVKIGYDEALSHRIMAGADAILVPSRFEPCGLTQLYGLRYGTVPLVALTGGLADTVIHTSPAALAARASTGIQFFPVTAHALADALIELCALYAKPKTWALLARNGMKHAVGWDPSAEAYRDLYSEALRTS